MFWFMIPFFVYAFIMGLLMIFFPEKLWKLQQWFSVKNGEPSDGYLKQCPVVGIIVWIGLLFFIFYVVRMDSPGSLPW